MTNDVIITECNKIMEHKVTVNKWILEFEPLQCGYKRKNILASST